MRRILLLISALLLVAADAKEDAVKAELMKLQGRWLIERVELGGGNVTSIIKMEVFEFMDTKFFIWQSKDKKATKDSNGCSIAINPAKDPKWIDIKEFALAIYKIEGDSLTICWDEERPNLFKTSKETPGHRLWFLKRLKD